LPPTDGDVCTTAAEHACRRALRCASGKLDGPIERHSLRVFFVMERLRKRLDVEYNREVLCAALLHDIGVYDPAARPRFYLAHGRASATAVPRPLTYSHPSDGRGRGCRDAWTL
jgi:hypothetical protein